MRIRKSIIAMAIVVSILFASQSVSAAPASTLETTDVHYFIGYGYHIKSNEFFMGYLGFYWDVDSFIWTNNTDHDIAIEPWLYSPSGLQYDMDIASVDYYQLPDGRLGDLLVEPDKEGQYVYKKSLGPNDGPASPITIRPGKTAYFWIEPAEQDFSKEKNYVFWINEVPVKK
ncbi:hypothetical protein ACFOLF_13460 [Paenibacillus sepulcri]|uniref:Uncharacterized protein n=1 Tax=Paenibacillus sepulcri TaxID=359917 RepID=A0ABS7C278_9BACL|nr:hypothetical protein [Paenibacillus sepulcri]